MTRRPSNSRVARGIKTTTVKPASWQAFDALPRPVREVIWMAPQSINPIDAETLVRMAGAEDAAMSLIDAVYREIQQFSDDHRRRYARPLPHVAAGATLQRYDAAARARARRKIR